MLGKHKKIIFTLLVVMLFIPTSFASEGNDTNRKYTEEEIRYMVMVLNQTVVTSGDCFANFSTIDYFADESTENENYTMSEIYDTNHTFSYDDLRDQNLFNESNNKSKCFQGEIFNESVVEFSTIFSSPDCFKNTELSNGKNILLNKNIYLTESEPFDWVISNKKIKMNIKGIEIQNVSEKSIAATATESITATEDTVPAVIVTGATCDWHWIQNKTATNSITIRNYGSTSASGYVTIGSIEDDSGWGSTFTNLAPGAEITKTIPFYVDSTKFPSVGAKEVRVVVLVQSGSYYVPTHAPKLPAIFVESYNNDPGYLEDPENGIYLDTSDLHHQNEYSIATKAAIAGDNTTSPVETAIKIHNSVHATMHYNVSALNPDYTGSDQWIINNNYNGICDEYAVLSVSYYRSLGIPSRQLLMSFYPPGSTTLSAHSFTEIWDGTRWIHSDTKISSTNGFDNPRYYVNEGFDVTLVAAVTGADDSISNTDGADDDGILSHGDYACIYSQDLITKYA
ncbi:transglutaminase-like domain-containing protein [Methanosarcina sp. T3]|uniref:transglutaminase-like domain-containing protein n=1 Tax=Methanosarcina sp. T3 TaxID=3439062 RepID=UPI003F848920